MRSGRIDYLWQTFAVLSVAGLSWLYFSMYGQLPPDRNRVLVLAFGCAGTILAVLAASLSVRKRLAYQGVGKLSAWLNAHIYIGIVSAFAILYHSGFRMGSPVPAILLSFYWFTIVSGVMGLWLSRKVPPLLTAIEENPAIIEDLLSVRAECLRGMLELAAGGSAKFSALVKDSLLPQTASWKRMGRFYRNRTTFAEEISAFQKEQEWALGWLAAPEHRAYQRAGEYALRVNKMNAELLLHRVMRGWLTIHITTTAAMFGFAALHIFSVLYY
ncbi:MAG: hypothetical protein HYX27_19245 [Acidobacteria bacterium]|nr:hypothetical protein [Acidobacteriota bacterium]